MNQSMLSILELDLLNGKMCGSQTVFLDLKKQGSEIDLVPGIKFKNCTEQHAYICSTSKYHLLKFLIINSLQFIHP